MPSIVEHQSELDNALDALHQASRISAKQRTTKVSLIVDLICQHALDAGLDSEALQAVVQIVSVKTTLDQTSVTTLIKNLFPAERVSNDIVLTVVGALGQGKGKPSLGTQDSLVKWLMAIHEVASNQAIFSRLYGVLFSLLDMISIRRTSLCHLLSLITRRKHVKPFRIQQLLELSRSLGNEPALQGLLRVYKDYYPDVILGSMATSRKSFAPRPELEWQTKISSILNTATDSEDGSIERHTGFKVQRPNEKCRKPSAIPNVHTYHATETSVTLEGIDSVDDFVEKLDVIEPPGQLISVLTDPLLQKYVELRSTPLIRSRVDLWLATCLEEQLHAIDTGIRDEQLLHEVLNGLLTYTHYTKSVLPFLKGYLQSWTGLEHVDAILGLVSFIPVDSFRDTYSIYFLPIERALSAYGVSAFTKLMYFYSDIVQNHICATLSEQVDGMNTSKQALQELAAHVSDLATSLLLTLPPASGAPLISAILTFYEILSKSSKPHSIPIILPSTHMIYLLTQTPSANTLCRVCGVIGSYKQAFDEHPRPVGTYYPVDVINKMNLCLRDIYNLLWVARALDVTPLKSAGLFCDPALRSLLDVYLSNLDHEYAIGIAFSFSHNPWLSSISAAAWRTLEEREIEKERYDRRSVTYHQGPVRQRSLEVLRKKGGVSLDWDGAKGYKAFVLEWLSERGLSGVRNLMLVTAVDLRKNT